MNVGQVKNSTAANGNANDLAQAMMDALKNGDVQAAMSAMQGLLNSRGAKVQGQATQPGFSDKLKQGLDGVKIQLSPAEASACDATMAAAKPAASNTTDP
ncbi:MAG TPA: hypothetical protein VGO62_05470, partial [Myxococcota bacterium]